jgi:hypothetical protein
MEHLDFRSIEDDYRDLEKLIDEEFPDATLRFLRNEHLLIIDATTIAEELLDEDLRLLGALIKVATHRGTHVVMGNFKGIDIFHRARPKRKGVGENLQESQSEKP